MRQIFIVIILILLMLIYQHSFQKIDQDLIFYIQWKTKHNIHFSQQQNHFRFMIFLETLKQIQIHNTNKSNTWKKGLNQFSALTQQQFVNKYLKNIIPMVPLSQIEKIDNITQDNQQINWYQKGAVTEVKNQLQCMSNYAFASVGSIQSLYFIKQRTLQSLSQQQIVQCSHSYGNHGCQSGIIQYAFKFIIQNGIVQQKIYPYTGLDKSCKIKKGQYKISNYSYDRGCSNLYRALLIQPIAVSVDSINWKNYKQGIFNNCGVQLNHGILLVGMTDEYWYLKNSWGTSWGMNGYIKISRGNTCGICELPCHPNL